MRSMLSAGSRWAWTACMLISMAVCAMVSGSGVCAQTKAAAETPSVDEWGRLLAANDLDNKGNAPFHLIMDVQLYDLDGKPSGTGTVEEWWAAPGSMKSVIHFPELNEDGSAKDSTSPHAIRSEHLLSELIDAAVRPVPKEPFPGEKLKNETQKFGKVALRCTVPERDPVSPMLCMDPNTEDVRSVMRLDQYEVIVRNSMVTFHGTFVPMGLQIAYMGLEAISAKVTSFQDFDPNTSDVKLPAPNYGEDRIVIAGHVSGGVAAGRRISFVAPVYPEMAKMQHLSGTVVFAATVGKDGTVQKLAPLARTSSIFVDAAMNAVRQWKYAPYLLNGEPTEVDTTITVNFTLNN